MEEAKLNIGIMFFSQSELDENEEEQQIAIELIENNSSNDSSQEDIANREGNRVINDEEAKRRTTERQLLRENNPLSLTNIEAITQRLGAEAADRFRSMVENRREANNSRITNRFNMTWLRNYITDPCDLDLLDEGNSGYLKTVIGWYGPSAGLLLIKLNNTNIKSMQISYKTCAESKVTCLSKLISKLFPSDSLFKDESSKIKYLNALYCCFPNIKLILKYKNYNEDELVILKVMLDSSTYILKLSDGPFFSLYIKDIIPTSLKFYQMLSALDNSTSDGTECRLSKSLKRAITKSIIKLSSSSSYSTFLKSSLFLNGCKNKEIVKFYKQEIQTYQEICSLKADQIYT